MLTFIAALITYTIFLTIFSASTPLVLGFMVLTLALNIALTAATSAFSWFGFIIFLIYIGGMLVMFAYFAALTPNSSPMLALTSLILITTLLLLFFHFYPDMPSLNSASVTTPFSTPSLIGPLFSLKNLPPLILLALILFLALISVVKISNHSAGPLRPFHKK